MTPTSSYFPGGKLLGAHGAPFETTSRPLVPHRGRPSAAQARAGRNGSHATADRHAYLMAKRALDVAAAAIALLLLAPLFVVVALLIKLQDRGPVIFVQKRVGRRRHEFDFPKFRSMRVDAEAQKASLMSLNEHKCGVVFKIRRDPRVTRVGRFIRKYSIDELPQLWCVLRGDMSLVGPRPPLPSEVRLYTVEQWRRLDVTPGLTCIWQVSGRADLDFLEQVRLDLEYIDHRSLLLDLRILLRTLPAVVSGRGAY